MKRITRAEVQVALNDLNAIRADSDARGTIILTRQQPGDSHRIYHLELHLTNMSVPLVGCTSRMNLREAYSAICGMLTVWGGWDPT